MYFSNCTIRDRFRWLEITALRRACFVLILSILTACLSTTIRIIKAASLSLSRHAQSCGHLCSPRVGNAASSPTYVCVQVGIPEDGGASRCRAHSPRNGSRYLPVPGGAAGARMGHGPSCCLCGAGGLRGGERWSPWPRLCHPGQGAPARLVEGWSRLLQSHVLGDTVSSC